MILIDVYLANAITGSKEGDPLQSNQELAEQFKALADITRLQIIEMLSCGEVYGCRMLEHLPIRQPTLSYHLKILTDSRIIIGNHEGSWIKYSINLEQLNNLTDFLDHLQTSQPNHIELTGLHLRKKGS